MVVRINGDVKNLSRMPINLPRVKVKFLQGFPAFRVDIDTPERPDELDTSLDAAFALLGSPDAWQTFIFDMINHGGLSAIRNTVTALKARNRHRYTGYVI